MDLEPIVVEVKPPKTPFKLPFKLPKSPFNSSRTTKIITAVAAAVIVLSVGLLIVFTVLANNDSYKKKHNIVNAVDEIAINNEAVKSNAALPGGGTVTGKGGTSGTNSPVITLTASQAAVTKGNKVTLKWSATNNPKSCVASDDWTGDQPAAGSFETVALTNLQTYQFTLTCKTDTGTGFSTVSVNAIEQGGSGSVGRPEVVITALPSSIIVGKSTTLSWAVSNEPTSCVANDDWTGNKVSTGTQSTGILGSVKSYKFTLTCTNASGSGYASTTVDVSNPPQDIPTVNISVNPVGPVTPGSSVTIIWSVTNGSTSCTASDGWSGSKASSGSQTVGPLNTIQVYGFTLTCSNSSGTGFETATLQVLPSIPSVALTASPSTLNTGSSSTLSWSATGSPTSCTASGSWTGSKAASGSVGTGTFSTQGTYTYYLTCDNQAGSSKTASATVTVNIPPVPVVSINATPAIITSGSSSNLTWSATNTPSSCIASGDWTGSKSVSGTVSTGALSSIRTYSYTLTCTNAGGSGSATASISVGSSAPATSPPVVTISASPTSIGTGSSSSISWSATNSPTSCTASNAWTGSKAASGTTSTGTMNTAGVFTYTLACSNSAGSRSASATVTVIAVPVVTISVAPTTITSGSSATINWSVTNSPTSCTAGGSWSGTKASSGSQTTGAINTAGTYSYSLSCTNAGGTRSATATLTVNAPVATYCTGLTPCYGPATLATHATTSNCWGYITSGASSKLYNLKGFAPRHSGNSSTILTAANCGRLVSWAGAPNNGKHTSAKANTQATLNGYAVGWYDPASPN